MIQNISIWLRHSNGKKGKNVSASLFPKKKSGLKQIDLAFTAFVP